MESTLGNWISRLLDRADRERFSGISQLLEPGTLIPVGILKEIKLKVLDFAASHPDLFLDAAFLYYAKFIQSIEVANLPSECALIPHYLKTIEILKTLRNEEAQELEVNFEPYLTIIIDGIKEILLTFESIEKTFEFLKMLKEIEQKFEILIKIEEFEFVDVVIQEYVENEVDLTKSYSAITKIKKEWEFDLFYAEGSWITKARQRLEEENKETCDKNHIKDILILLNLFQNEYYPEIKEEIIHFCEGFEIDSSEIFNSEPSNRRIQFLHEASAPSSEFSPIFESHLITRRSQFRLKKRPISKMHDHITIWEGYCLFNLQRICIKEYKEGEKNKRNQGDNAGSVDKVNQEVIDQYNNEATIMQNLSEIGSSLYLEHYSHFKEGDSYFIVMEFCEFDLREVISKKEPFSKYELAYFTHTFIKGLSLLKTEAHIYHRDIKPANIMIGSDNEFKLIDFNTSKTFEKDSFQIGLDIPSLVGTDEYSSPEHFKCLKQRTENEHSRELNDVYSLGLVILEMYTLETIVQYRISNKAFTKMLEEQKSQIKIQWLSILLGEMLIDDWTSRPRFGNLLEMIEKNEDFMNDVREYNNHRRANI